MSERKPVTSQVTKHRFSKIVASVCGHLLATLTLFAAFTSLFLTEQTLGLMKIGVMDEALRPNIVGPAVLILGLAGCAWALMFIIFQLAKSHVQRPKHVLKKARGTVITETLVVLPAFFLLTFGLAQMAINSIAGILSTLASYEVSRSLTSWSVEEGNNRAPGGAPNHTYIQQKMRLHAAMVIAPVTPEFSQAAPCNLPFSVTSALDGIRGIGTNSWGSTSGQGRVFSMAEAFGHRTFAERGPSKLAGAYCAIQVNWTNVNPDTTSTLRSDFTTRLDYYHPAAMPIIGWIFTNTGGGTHPWATNNVTRIERSYRLRTYVTPNTFLPY